MGETASGNENRSIIFKELKDSGIVSVARISKAHTAAENILRHYTEAFISIFYRVHGVFLPDMGLSFNYSPLITQEQNGQQPGTQIKVQDNRQQLIASERRESGRSVSWGKDRETDRNAEVHAQMKPRSLLRTINQDDDGTGQKSFAFETNNIQHLLNKDSGAAGVITMYGGHQQKRIQARPEAIRKNLSFEQEKPSRVIQGVWLGLSSSLNDLTEQATTCLSDLPQHAGPGISEDHACSGSSPPRLTGNFYDSSNTHRSTSVRGPQFGNFSPTELDYAPVGNCSSSATPTGTDPQQDSIQNTPCVNPAQIMNQQERDDIGPRFDRIRPSQSATLNYPHMFIQEPLVASTHTSAINNPLEAPTESYFFEEAPTELYSLGEPPINLYYLNGEQPIDLYNLEGETPIDLYSFGGGEGM